MRARQRRVARGLPDGFLRHHIHSILVQPESAAALFVKQTSKPFSSSRTRTCRTQPPSHGTPHSLATSDPVCLVLFGPPSTPNSGGSHRIDAGSSSPARHTYRLSILLGKNQISAAYRYHSRGSLPSHANSAATSWPRCERLSNTERGRELGRYPVERLGLNQGAQNVADGIARTVLLTFGEPPCLCCQAAQVRQLRAFREGCK